jgi:phosphatidate cytidylyltransferase
MEKECKKQCMIQKSAKSLASNACRIVGVFTKKLNVVDPSGNLKKRVESSIALLPIAIYAIYFSQNLFIFLTLAIAILMTSEWIEMTRKIDGSKWKVVGFFYVAIPLYSIIKLRLISSDIVFFMFAIIWATDIFAFFAGKTLGGAKILPSISPNKTWSGFFGGALASGFIGFISCFVFSGGALFFIFIAILLSIIEQISDLLESKFKRIFDVKDSGSIIPGHGGVLDRLDGMMLVAPILLSLVTIFPAKFGI